MGLAGSLIVACSMPRLCVDDLFVVPLGRLIGASPLSCSSRVPRACSGVSGNRVGPSLLSGPVVRPRAAGWCLLRQVADCSVAQAWSPFVANRVMHRALLGWCTCESPSHSRRWLPPRPTKWLSRSRRTGVSVESVAFAGRAPGHGDAEMLRGAPPRTPA